MEVWRSDQTWSTGTVTRKDDVKVHISLGLKLGDGQVCRHVVKGIPREDLHNRVRVPLLVKRLIQMDISSALATEAALRCLSVEAALNWLIENKKLL